MAGTNVTRKDIETYLSLEEECRQLNRQARDLEKQSREIAAKLRDFVVENGGKAKSVVRSGYVLAIEPKKGSVEWKTEFIRVAGMDAAEELIAVAPPKESLNVRPV